MFPSYANCILRVDLSNGRIVKQDLPRDLCKLYLGGKGFGTKILYDEVSGGIDPLSPLNKLIIAVGPSAGTPLPFSSKTGLYFKSPLTETYGESHVGGYFAPKMKWAGLDVIVVSGRARKPIYLYIHDGEAEIRDASHLWGKTTYETERIVKEETDRNSAVLEIGPAGENLVKFAAVCHANGWRQAGRCGPGAVMGSKNLKAIAVASDVREVRVADEAALKKLVDEIYGEIRRDPVGTLAENYRKYGTPAMVNISNSLRFFPTRYWSKVYFDGYLKVNPEAMSEILVKSRACWNCPFACGKLVEVRDGPYAGTVVEGPEYETIFAFGGLCEIGDIKAIAKINDLCDMYGVDTISMGNVAGFAIEAYMRGKLETEVPLRYSDPESVIWLIERVVERRGVGSILSEGVKRASEILNLREIAVHVKGLEPPGYDPRALKGMALSYATSPRGACHLRSVMYAVDASGAVNRLVGDEERARICVDQENRYIIFDTLHICRFARKIFDWNTLTRAVNSLTGFNYSEKDIRGVAERIRTVARLFEISCGVTGKDDVIPERFMREPVFSGGSSVKVGRQELETMVKTYYTLRGWSSEGVPLEETLRSLLIEGKK